jgi:hypothetical protein
MRCGTQGCFSVRSIVGAGIDRVITSDDPRGPLTITYCKGSADGGCTDHRDTAFSPGTYPITCTCDAASVPL